MFALAVLASASGLAAGRTVDWPGHGGPPDESGYSPLREISLDNIGELGLAWSLELPGEQMLEATPLAVDGVLYFTGSYSAVYAVDAVSGKLLWKHDPEVWRHNPNKMNYIFGANRGAAYADGRVFVCTMDGRLLALDANTGRLLWSAETVGRDDKRTSTGAPRTFNGKVIIGHGGGDLGTRGYVTAYDAATGEQAWRFHVVPGSPEENKGDPAMERAAATWNGEYWKTGTGGAPWNGITFDPELNRIYIGTGNSGPYDPERRSPGDGDNLYLTSIVALDADTGRYVWHYQMNPREAWDYKATANIITATLRIDGKDRKVLMQAPSNGFFYVIDRVDGRLISAEKIGKVTWAERIDRETGRPVEAPNIRYETGESTIWPSVFGAHNWQAMSFNPETGLVYIPYIQLGMKFTRTPATFSGVTSVPVIADPQDGKGALLAWDPIAQKERWRVPHEWMWNGGTMTTAENLVFQGTADGYFTAYDAKNGDRVWQFNAGLGIISAPISYAVAGKQYVSVLVGWGASNTCGMGLMSVGWKYGAQPRRLLTFTLGGQAKLPPTAPPDTSVQPVDDPAVEIDTADVEPGRELFSTYCSACHGKDAVSAGAPAPDLRESKLALYPESLWSVVHHGTLLSKGMPRFSMLNESDVRRIHAFIRARARQSSVQTSGRDTAQ